MSAANAIARAEAAGVRLWLDGSAVRMEAAAPPPADLLTELRTHRADVTRLLAEQDNLARYGDAVPLGFAAPPVALEHDAVEAEAMADFYAMPPALAAYEPTDPDPLRDGLLLAARTCPPALVDAMEMRT